MDEVVTVVTKPRKICYFIIFSVLIYMMHREHSLVSCLTSAANGNYFISIKHAPV